MMGTLVRYTAARVALFGVALGALYLLNMRGFPLFLAAIFISGLVSFIALSGQRDRMSFSLVRRYRELKRRLDEGASSEDPENSSEDGRRSPPDSPDSRT